MSLEGLIWIPIIIGIVCFTIAILSKAFVIIRPIERGLIERLGKYNRFANPGLNLLIPVIDKVIKVNITEQMVDAQKQEIITEDNLNATVDAQIYYRVRSDEESVKNSIYNVNNYERQIINLERTTLRNIIGNLSLKRANSERATINVSLLETLEKETTSWGIDIVRAELKEIDPPKDVQETMNKVVKAENEKMAAVDYATAAETTADGVKRAAIKKAEGEKQSQILKAEGEKEAQILMAEGKAKAIETEYTAAQKYFVEGAVELKKLETVVEALSNNTKIILPEGKSLVNVIGDIAGNVIPIQK